MEVVLLFPRTDGKNVTVSKLGQLVWRRNGKPFNLLQKQIGQRIRKLKSERMLQSEGIKQSDGGRMWRQKGRQWHELAVERHEDGGVGGGSNATAGTYVSDIPHHWLQGDLSNVKKATPLKTKVIINGTDFLALNITGAVSKCHHALASTFASLPLGAFVSEMYGTAFAFVGMDIQWAISEELGGNESNAIDSGNSNQKNEPKNRHFANFDGKNVQIDILGTDNKNHYKSRHLANFNFPSGHLSVKCTARHLSSSAWTFTGPSTKAKKGEGLQNEGLGNEKNALDSVRSTPTKK